MKLTSQSVRPGWRPAVDKAARGEHTELAALFRQRPPNEPEIAILAAMLTRRRRSRYAAKRRFYDRLLHEAALRARAVQQALEVTEGRRYGRTHDNRKGQRERAITAAMAWLRLYGAVTEADATRLEEQVRYLLRRSRK